jgi:hypothetical protein|nr:hypothetical protein [uncultured Anaerostipes sp.]DAQ13428.1 MAG TPA: Protein of unknown function (DUF1617) [Caudoviricetes sp.]
MKLKEMVQRLEGLTRQANKIYTAKLGYAISKNIKTFQEVIKDYDENRVKICERYAEKDQDGKARIEEDKYVFTEDNEKIVNEECGDLQDVDQEISFLKVPFSELERCEEIERYDIPSVSDVNDLMFMIEE